jgi:hypothetical protein
MFETSESTDLLDLALAKAQAEIQVASKDKTNPHFKSNYADLPAIRQACQAALAKFEISVTQWPLHTEDQRLHIITRIAHKGQFMKATFSMPVDKNTAQGYGSAVTYARRFTLASALGIVADEDDDGNKATELAPPPFNPAPKPTSSKPNFAVLIELATKAGLTASDMTTIVTQKFNKKSSQELTKEEFEELVNMLKEKAK